MNTDNNAITTENAENTNAQVLEKIKALTAERKAKREAVVQAVDKLWADYVEWREKEYRITREALLKQLTDNHLARLAKREERQKEALEKAEEKKRKAEAKLEALKSAAKPADETPAKSTTEDAPAAKPKKAAKKTTEK